MKKSELIAKLNELCDGYENVNVYFDIRALDKENGFSIYVEHRPRRQHGGIHDLTQSMSKIADYKRRKGLTRW